jgi:hypothetical protein
VAAEMVVRQPQEIDGADQHHEIDSDEVRGEQDGNHPEHERSDDAVLKSLFLLVLGEPEDEDGEHHRVVSAQQAFEGDEQRDGDEICGCYIQGNCKC